MLMEAIKLVGSSRWPMEAFWWEHCMESIVDSYSWIVNHSPATNLEELALITNKYSYFPF